MQGTVLAVGEPARRSAGLAIIASLALAATFGAMTVLSKEIPALNLSQPWQDDPYDVPVSLDFALLPLLVSIGLLRVQLCRRYKPLPARRITDLLRLVGAALGLCLVTEVTQWVAVALGRHHATWTAVTSGQVVILAVLTAATVGAGVLVRRAGHLIATLARPAAQPDWLADAVALALRVVRWTAAQVITRVRVHPVAAAGLLAVGLAFPFVTAKIVLEDYPVPLVLLSSVFVTASLFVLVVVVGAYLRVVGRRQATPPAWLITTVVACTAGTVAFAFHDSLLSDQAVPQLSALYFGAGLAAGAVSLALQMLRRLHTSRPPTDRRR